MRMWSLLLLLLVAADYTQLAAAGKATKSKSSSRKTSTSTDGAVTFNINAAANQPPVSQAAITTPVQSFQSFLQLLQPPLSDIPLPPLDDVVAAALQQMAVTAPTSTTSEECPASVDPTAAAATNGPSDTGVTPQQATLPANAASTAAAASCSSADPATSAGAEAGAAQAATTLSTTSAAAVDSTAPGSAASVQPPTAAGASSSTSDPPPDDKEFAAVRQGITNRVAKTVIGLGLDLRHYLTTTTASLTAPSIETTRHMTEEERRAALAQFAYNAEITSTADIQCILGTAQPGLPVNVSPQHGAPSTSSTGNNGGTTPGTDADAGPNQEPPKPDNGSCSC